MHPVTFSFSQLLSIAYHIDKQLLDICFHDGAVHRYLNVPSTIYFSLVHAYSPDNYFERNIKSAFSFVQVGLNK